MKPRRPTKSQGGNWKLHLRNEDGDPACGQRIKVNLALTGNVSAVTCKRCLPIAKSAKDRALEQAFGLPETVPFTFGRVLPESADI